MTTRQYTRQRDETRQFIGQRTLDTHNLAMPPAYEDSIKTGLYVQMWRELAEALGSGGEFYVKFEPLETDVQMALTIKRLRITVAPLHEVKHEQETDPR